MESMVATGLIGLKAIALFLFLITCFFTLRAASRPTSVRPGAQIVNILLYIGTAIGYYALVNIAVNMVFAVAIVVAGLVVGLLAGAKANISSEGSQAVLKRSAISSWLLAAAYLISIFFNYFGTKTLMSVGMLLVIGAVISMVSSGLMEIIKSSKYKTNIVPAVGQVD